MIIIVPFGIKVDGTDIAFVDCDNVKLTVSSPSQGIWPGSGRTELQSKKSLSSEVAFDDLTDF